MIVKLLTERHLKFLSLKGGCIGQYESTLVKMPHCWKSHVIFLLMSVWSNFGTFKQRRSTMTCMLGTPQQSVSHTNSC